jgi:hypothetical protein
MWHILTRLGEAEILLPLAALACALLAASEPSRKPALTWLALIGVAVAVTAATKVAFIGWGIGWAQVNFTGISGHCALAAAIYPVLTSTLVAPKRQWGRRYALVLGCGLALLVGYSRIAVGAHSLSEVLAGLALGGLMSLLALAASATSVLSMRPVFPAILLGWMAVAPFELQASQTHVWVTRLALAVSGHDKPFKRTDLLGRAHDPRLQSWGLPKPAVELARATA